MAVKTRWIEPKPRWGAVRCEIGPTTEMGIECKTSQWASYLDPRVQGYGETEEEAVAAWRRLYLEAMASK